MRRPAGSTGSPSKHSRITGRDARANCEAFASQAFWEGYARLPESIRSLADKNYALLKQNPRHPSLQLKKVGPFWSVRIGSSYRALAVEIEDGLLWFWIGSHADYDAMI